MKYNSYMFFLLQENESVLSWQYTIFLEEEKHVKDLYFIASINQQ